MKILFITDLYPVKENEKTTPRTLFDFVQEWKAAGNEVDVIKFLDSVLGSNKTAGKEI